MSENRDEKVPEVADRAVLGGEEGCSSLSHPQQGDRTWGGGGGGGVVDLPSATLTSLSPEKLGCLWEDLQAERKAVLMEGEVERGWWSFLGSPRSHWAPTLFLVGRAASFVGVRTRRKAATPSTPSTAVQLQPTALSRWVRIPAPGCGEEWSLQGQPQPPAQSPQLLLGSQQLGNPRSPKNHPLGHGAAGCGDHEAAPWQSNAAMPCGERG